jgi:hypothetical protein
MKAFDLFLKEHAMGEEPLLPSTQGELGALDLHDEQVRDGLNMELLDITDSPERMLPVITFDRVREVLGAAGYWIPSATMNSALFDEEIGDEVFVLSPPTKDADQPVKADCYLYFAFAETETGDWDVLAEVVNSLELEDILSDQQ